MTKSESDVLLVTVIYTMLAVSAGTTALLAFGASTFALCFMGAGLLVGAVALAFEKTPPGVVE